METSPQEKLSGKTILVVEDELFLALDLQDALHGGGFHIQGPAASVERALLLITAQRPDAAVLDVTLGQEKVTPVALLLRSLEVPFVLASASDAAELARHEVLTGTRNLGKPTDLKQLVEVMHGICAGSHIYLAT